MALSEGYRFGHFVVGPEIGRGSSTIVYRATHASLGREVALKIRSQLADKEEAECDRLLQEARSVAAIRHEHIVDVYDMGVWQGTAFSVMELLEGENLEQYLERHAPLTDEDAARILLPVVSALAQIHKAGTVHNNLKPSNIFLANGRHGQPRPTLLDFGISAHRPGRKTENDEQHGLAELASARYLSPEAARGDEERTPKSDQYSLAAILFHCATDDSPYRADDLDSLLKAIAGGELVEPRERNPLVSQEMATLITKAMQLQPEDRFSDMQELGKLLVERAEYRVKMTWARSFDPTLAIAAAPAGTAATSDTVDTAAAPSDTAGTAAIAETQASNHDPSLEHGPQPVPQAEQTDSAVGIEAEPPTRRRLAWVALLLLIALLLLFNRGALETLMSTEPAESARSDSAKTQGVERADLVTQRHSLSPGADKNLGGRAAGTPAASPGATGSGADGSGTDGSGADGSDSTSSGADGSDATGSDAAQADTGNADAPPSEGAERSEDQADEEPDKTWLTVHPRYARVLLDNELVSPSGPKRELPLDGERHEVSIFARGYRPRKFGYLDKLPFKRVRLAKRLVARDVDDERDDLMIVSDSELQASAQQVDNSPPAGTNGAPILD